MTSEQERDIKKEKEAIEADKNLYQNEAMRKQQKKETPQEEGIRLAKLTKELMKKKTN